MVVDYNNEYFVTIKECYMKLTVSLENESEEVKKVLYKEKRILDGVLTLENIEKLINNKYKFNLTEMERYYIITSIYVSNKSNEIVRYS